MEKIANYKLAAKEVLSEIAARKNRSRNSTTYQLITDEITGNYLLLRNGWQGGTRLYGIIIHVEVKADGKVWLQQDATDLVIADLLMEKGVATDDVILGFLTPAMREDMEVGV
ncbi:MAG: XisI protein [Saprospiraceae bacterium]|nr:XisI protein [Saprospiraceae bacterium]